MKGKCSQDLQKLIAEMVNQSYFYIFRRFGYAD